MEYNIVHQGGDVVATLSGDVTLAAAPRFERMTAQIFEGDTTSQVLDLEKVTRLDSAGLGLLLLVQRRAKEIGVSVTLRGASGHILDTLKNANFDRLFTLAG